MTDFLERARLVAEITELRKQQSEARIRDIYAARGTRFWPLAMASIAALMALVW